MFYHKILIILLQVVFDKCLKYQHGSGKDDDKEYCMCVQHDNDCRAHDAWFFRI